MMLRKKRKLLEMSEDELEAVINVILPGRFTRKHSKSNLQEEAIHWLLANGLLLSHEFTLIEMDDGSYGVLTDKNRCTCCQRSVLPSVNRAHGEMKKNTSVHSISEKVEETSFTEQSRQVKFDDDILTERNLRAIANSVFMYATFRSLTPSSGVKKTQKINRNVSREHTILVPAVSKGDSKSVVIKVQPLPMGPMLSNTTPKIVKGFKTKPEDKKRQKVGIAQCCNEFGNCCVSLLSNC